MIKYKKAVDVRDSSRVVYAHFHDENYLLQINNYAFASPVWIVWHLDTVEYQNLAPEQFDERYILEENCPLLLREMLDSFPTFEEWCDSLEAPRQ